MALTLMSLGERRMNESSDPLQWRWLDAPRTGNLVLLREVGWAHGQVNASFRVGTAEFAARTRSAQARSALGWGTRERCGSDSDPMLDAGTPRELGSKGRLRDPVQVRREDWGDLADLPASAPDFREAGVCSENLTDLCPSPCHAEDGKLTGEFRG
jgi:hypothetical protein